MSPWQTAPAADPGGRGAHLDNRIPAAETGVSWAMYREDLQRELERAYQQGGSF